MARNNYNDMKIPETATTTIRTTTRITARTVIRTRARITVRTAIRIRVRTTISVSLTPRSRPMSMGRLFTYTDSKKRTGDGR